MLRDEKGCKFLNTILISRFSKFKGKQTSGFNTTSFSQRIFGLINLLRKAICLTVKRFDHSRSSELYFMFAEKFAILSVTPSQDQYRYVLSKKAVIL